MINNIQDVVERQLCCGCGVCAYLSPDSIEMVDSTESGRRPRHKGNRVDDSDAMKACPGIALEHAAGGHPDGAIPQLLPAWGPVLEVWEGHATDEAIRFAGSSGGAASALALACIETGGMHGVLHVRARGDAPILNETVLSTTREEILRATGSRYAPASPCDGLHMVEAAPGPCVFIGKPCDVAAVRNATRLRAPLREKVGVTIAFFCAGTPTTKGTMALIERLGIEGPSDVIEIRYRGNGWPGRTVFTVKTAAGTETRSLSYEEAWGEVLSNHKQWRCNVCADHTGEFADIAVGDPWHRRRDPREPGLSLILVRTERGRRILADAVAAGYLAVERSEHSALPAAQPELLRGRGAVWGRLLACRLMGVPAPRYRGMPMFRHWWSRLSWREKAGATVGTVRRVHRRRLRARATDAS
ncbi:MAG: Coenzyme F420 hydrogenase/dehydrogenase, beta subunit C-terminal domain [Phycisphaerales bacterium]